MKRTLTLAAVFAAALPPIAAAGEIPTLETIVVRDAKLAAPTTQELPPHALPVPPPTDGAELLTRVPGVSAVKMGSHGGDPVIRGQSMDQVNVVIDGIQVFGGCPNRMDPATAYAPPELYDRITVVRGPHSVADGGGSGGTVRFHRDRPQLGEETTVYGTLGGGYRGNHDQAQGFADVTAGNQRGDLRLSGVVQEGHDYEDGNGNTVRSGFQEKGGSATLGWNPSDATRVELSVAATYADDVQYAGAGMDAPSTDDEMGRLTLTHDYGQAGVMRRVRAELYGSQVAHVMDNYTLRSAPVMGGNPQRKEAPSTSDTWGGKLEMGLAAGGIDWTVGVDHRNNQREATRWWYNPANGARTSESLLWPGVEIAATGFYVEGATPLAGGRVTAGVRYDRVEAEASKAGDNPAKIMGPKVWQGPNTMYTNYYGRTATPETEHNLGGLLRYERAWSENLDWYLALSRTMRTADATERYISSQMDPTSPTNNWVGNPGLDPEAHHQLQAGLTWRGGQGLTVAVDAFYNRVNDYILRDTARGQTGILLADGATIYRNVDATLVGGEVELAKAWSPQWQSRLTLAHVRAENTTDNRPIAQTPPLNGAFSTDYQGETWGAGFDWRFAAKQNRVDDNTATGSGLDAGQTAGYGVLNLHAQVDLPRGFTLKLGVDNLFDHFYAEHLNKSSAFDVTQVRVNEPGRTAWIRLSMDFDL